jgi:hypothetical protein
MAAVFSNVCSLGAKQTSNEQAHKSVSDSAETWAAQDFRGAKALFVPSLKRDIAPSIGMLRQSRRSKAARVRSMLLPMGL